MKKIYEAPMAEVIELETAGMLCTSTGIGGEATDPAKARLWDDDWDLSDDTEE